MYKGLRLDQYPTGLVSIGNRKGSYTRCLRCSRERGMWSVTLVEHLQFLEGSGNVVYTFRIIFL